MATPPASSSKLGCFATMGWQLGRDKWRKYKVNHVYKGEDEVEAFFRRVLAKIRSYYPKVLAFVDSGLVLLIFMIMTLWALFAVDILQATDETDTYDKPFAMVSLVFMILFSVEVAIRSVTQPFYFSVELFGKCRGPGFFFALDLLATVTMYQDVMPLFVDKQEQFSSSATVAAGSELEITQSLETGTRVGRMLRLIRVVRVCQRVERGDDRAPRAPPPGLPRGARRASAAPGRASAAQSSEGGRRGRRLVMCVLTPERGRRRA